MYMVPTSKFPLIDLGMHEPLREDSRDDSKFFFKGRWVGLRVVTADLHVRMSGGGGGGQGGPRP